MDSNNGYGELNFASHWYALHTKNRHEKKVEVRLKEKGVISFLPLNTVYHRWSDRHKKIQEPLFSCYVFVFIALRDRLQVLQTPGAVKLVSFNGIPARIPAEQINAIQQVLESKPTVHAAEFFTAGKKVRIARGPLKGLAGTVFTYKNYNQVIITVDAIKQAFAVEINPCDLES